MLADGGVFCGGYLAKSVSLHLIVWILSTLTDIVLIIAVVKGHKDRPLWQVWFRDGQKAALIIGSKSKNSY
jgi:hypothetical protein